MSSLFRGLSAFPITPCTPDGEVIEADFAALLQRLRDAGVDSAGVLGSTGSYPYLAREQRARAIAIAREVLGDAVPIIAGIGHLRTDAAIALAQDAQNAGAQGLLLAPVSYTPLTDREFLAHTQAVADATALPICIYNNPGTTHFTVSDDLLVALAQIPSVRAVKHPGADQATTEKRLAALRPRLPSAFDVGFSGDMFALDTLGAGGAAWYSVIAGLFPKPSLAMTRAAQSGNLAQAAHLEVQLSPLWPILKDVGGVRLIYAMARAMGLTQAEPPRPLLLPDAADMARIEAVMDTI